MKRKFLAGIFMFLLTYISMEEGLYAQAMAKDSTITVSLQKRIPSDFEKEGWMMSDTLQHWETGETAIIICDMWNEHWCKGATARVAEMAPFMNNVVSIARERGILIVHAPSDVVKYYKDYPARRLGMK